MINIYLRGDELVVEGGGYHIGFVEEDQRAIYRLLHAKFGTEGEQQVQGFKPPPDDLRKRIGECGRKREFTNVDGRFVQYVTFDDLREIFLDAGKQ